MKSKFSPYMLGRSKGLTATEVMLNAYYYGVRGKEMKSMRKQRRNKMIFGFLKPVQVFPAVLIVLDLCASAVYLGYGDWRRTMYWLAAAVLTFCVTF